MTLLNIDCMQGLNELKPESVDIIFTDPPYIKDLYKQAYETLANEGIKALRPGGWMISYAPQFHLPEVFNILTNAGLEYYWTVAQLNNQANCLIFSRNVMAMWKPIIIFAKPPVSKPPHAFADRISGKQMKRYHPWEQSIHEALGLLSRFASSGDLIVDPFMGSGTVPLAAKLLGLNYVGMEIDPDTYQTAVCRMEQQPLDLTSFNGTSDELGNVVVIH